MSMPVGLSLDGTFHLHYKGVANKDKTELVDALQTFANQTIDIVDCLLLAKTHSAKGRLLSFDKDLNRLAKEVR
jgi:hypothetical protein